MKLALFLALVLAACGDKEPTSVGPSALENPSKASLTAPAHFHVKFDTTKGVIVAEFKRAWSPEGVDRVYSMVKCGYFSGVRFFRVVRGFVAQFGMHPEPRINNVWDRFRLPDEPRRESNEIGMITFANAGPNTRSNQLFINLRDNARSLDGRGFVPVGRVIEGMDVVRKLYWQYDEAPSQEQITARGNAYLSERFPKLDEIKSATVVFETQ